MKTVGQIIFQARKEQNISIEKLSQITKIDPNYLQALEKDQYELLPSHTFVKGFIRNVSQALGKNPDELTAIFRRDFPVSSSLKLTPDSLPKRCHPTKRKNQSPYLIILFSSLTFLTYLIFQLRAFLMPPKLEIYQPKENAVLISPITIEGSTSPDAVIQVNKNIIIKPDYTGYFITSIPLSLGESQLEIDVTNRFNRTNSKKISITLIPQ